MCVCVYYLEAPLYQSNCSILIINPCSIPVGLHSGHIVSLTKRVLDPRRELVPNDEMRLGNVHIHVIVIYYDTCVHNIMCLSN